MTMLAVLMCTIVVLSLTTAAIEQTVGSLSVTAQGRELVQTVDAANAGLEAELAVLHKYSTSAAGTTIPCSNSTATVASAADNSGVSSYTLSMTDPVGSAGSATSSGLVACSSSHTFTIPNLDPWYVLLQSVGTSVGGNANGLSNGRTLQALVEVADSSAVTTTTTTIFPTTTVSPTTTTVAPTTTTTLAATTYTSNASGQAVNLALGGTSVAYLTPATTANNNGTGSNSPSVVQPGVSLPVADNFVSVQAGTQIAEANTDGSSYSCAGALSSGRTLTGGSAAGACAVGGTGTAGVALNISGIPGVTAAADITVGTISIGGLTLNMDGATSWATGNAGGTSMTGNASLVNASVTVSATVTLLGIRTAVNATMALGLNSSLTGPTDLITAITNAIAGNSVLSPIASPLASSLSSALSLTADYQSTSGGVFTVSGLHIGIVGSTVSADLAKSTVGPNTVNTPATTTTTSTTVPATTTTTVPGATTTTSTTVALPANGVTVEYIKQVA